MRAISLIPPVEKCNAFFTTNLLDHVKILSLYIFYAILLWYIPYYLSYTNYTQINLYS